MAAIEELRAAVAHIGRTFQITGDAVVEATRGTDIGPAFIQTMGEAILRLESVVESTSLFEWAKFGEEDRQTKRTADAATDTDLTPHWWESSLREEGRQTPRRRTKATRTGIPAADSEDNDCGAGSGRRTHATTTVRSYAEVVGLGGSDSSASEMEVEEGFTTVERRSTVRRKNVQTTRIPVILIIRPEKPTAVMIRLRQ